MKFYNVSTKRTYTDKTGAEKTKWLQVGTLNETDDGKKFLTLNMFPNESFYVFEQEERENNQNQVERYKSRNKVEEEIDKQQELYGELKPSDDDNQEINLTKIPF